MRLNLVYNINGGAGSSGRQARAARASHLERASSAPRTLKSARLLLTTILLFCAAGAGANGYQLVGANGDYSVGGSQLTSGQLQAAQVSPQSGPTKTADLLTAFIANIRTAPSIKMDFELRTQVAKNSASSTLSASSASMASQNYTGSVIAAGNSYKLENSQFELYCDGITKWIVNHSGQEITIFQHDTTQTDIIENPMGFFTSVNKGYDYPERPKNDIVKGIHQSINGKQIRLIDLKPKSKQTAYKSIILGIDPATNQPLLVKYTARDNSVYTIIITKFSRLNTPIASGTFVLPEPKPAGYFVNDLR